MLSACLFEPHFAGSSSRQVHSFPELKQETAGRCFTAGHHHFTSTLFCALLVCLSADNWFIVTWVVLQSTPLLPTLVGPEVIVATDHS